jgi:4-carboxymuconolactone decarboxylase
MREFKSVSVIVLLPLVVSIRIAAQGIGNAEGVLPKDVYPDSGSRLPTIHPERLTDRARKAYEETVASFPGAPQAMGAALRLHGTPGIIPQAESPLGLALMQLAILVTAREHDQPYEWSLHEMQAIAVGLDPAVIDVVRHRKPLAKLGEREAVIIQVGREIFGAHKLRSDTFARAMKVLGKSNLVDVVGLMADYSRTSAALTAFNQQMPPGWRQFLPLPFTPPNDIHPDSRSRLPLIPAVLPIAGGFQTALYGRQLAPVGTGPSYIRRHGAGLRSLETSVGRSMIDLAILVTAREHQAQYDWTINEVAAINGGLAPAVIEVVRNRKPVAGLAEREACLIEFGRELFQKHVVSAETYARAVKVFGERDLVDLVDVMGAHTREAAILTAFDQHLPEGQKPLLPLP